MTSGRILLGNHKTVNSNSVNGCKGQRTSNENNTRKKTQGQYGYSEPTATIVWESIITRNRKPTDVILWNIFPFHPYQVADILSNRTPTALELNTGTRYMKVLHDMVPNAKIIAIGSKSDKTLSKFDKTHSNVIHPANGGANIYRQQIATLLC